MTCTDGLRISLLGEIGVGDAGGEVPLPPPRKTRALLGFLVATGRPHRRERLCEMFWDLPDDPRAALRWTLSKLRKVLDRPGRTRIVADRERVRFDGAAACVDVQDIRARLQGHEVLSVAELAPLQTAAGRAIGCRARR